MSLKLMGEPVDVVFEIMRIVVIDISHEDDVLVFRF